MSAVIWAGAIGFLFILTIAGGLFFIRFIFLIDPFSVRKSLQAGKMAQMNLSVKLMQTQKSLQAKNRDLQLLSEKIKKANKDLNELIELKTKFFHIVTHEIRNPLGVISGYSEFLSGELGASLSEEQKRLFANIHNASKRANVLLSDLTDMVAIEGGKFKMQMEPAELSELLSACLPSLEFVTRQKQIRLVIEVAPGLPKINVDPNRVNQIFINLVTNASKFTPAEGTILIKAQKEVRSGGDASQECVLIQVKDSGVGFKPEDRTKIFERFYQCDNQDAYTKQKGFGLGLFIVLEIVRSHGGEIWAESEGLGKGATFWIRLPAMGARPSEPAAPKI